MMDLSLDYDKGVKFDCSECDLGLQKLRNCGNNHKPKKTILNGNVYEQCPRSLTFNKNSYDYLVTLYFNCKQNKSWPHGNSIMGETAYTKEFFDFCDGIVNKYKAKKDAEMQKKMDARTKNNKGNS